MFDGCWSVVRAVESVRLHVVLNAIQWPQVAVCHGRVRPVAQCGIGFAKCNRGELFRSPLVQGGPSATRRGAGNLCRGFSLRGVPEAENS